MTHRLIRPAAFLVAVVAFAAILTGCASHRYAYSACAATIEPVFLKPASSGGSSSHSSSSSSHSSSPKPGPSARSGASKPPSGQNTPTKTPEPGASSPSVKTNSASAPKAQQSKVSPPGEKSYTPPPADVKPPQKQIDAARSNAPTRVSLNGNGYRSPVTHHVYIFHDSGWYGSPGYVLDIFDPYNPFNYTSNVLSPFFGRPYLLVDRC